MMRQIRYTVTILAIIALAIGLATPVSASFSEIPDKVTQIYLNGNKDNDPPWDPGDESESESDLDGYLSFDKYSYAGCSNLWTWDATIARSRTNDPPWDPGDESGMSGEVCRV